MFKMFNIHVQLTYLQPNAKCVIIYTNILQMKAAVFCRLKIMLDLFQLGA